MSLVEEITSSIPNAKITDENITETTATIIEEVIIVATVDEEVSDDENCSFVEHDDDNNSISSSESEEDGDPDVLGEVLEGSDDEAEEDEEPLLREDDDELQELIEDSDNENSPAKDAEDDDGSSVEGEAVSIDTRLDDLNPDDESECSFEERDDDDNSDCDHEESELVNLDFDNLSEMDLITIDDHLTTSCGNNNGLGEDFGELTDGEPFYCMCLAINKVRESNPYSNDSSLNHTASNILDCLAQNLEFTQDEMEKVMDLEGEVFYDLNNSTEIMSDTELIELHCRILKYLLDNVDMDDYDTPYSPFDTFFRTIEVRNRQIMKVYCSHKNYTLIWNFIYHEINDFDSQDIEFFSKNALTQFYEQLVDERNDRVIPDEEETI